METIWNSFDGWCGVVPTSAIFTIWILVAVPGLLVRPSKLRMWISAMGSLFIGLFVVYVGVKGLFVMTDHANAMIQSPHFKGKPDDYLALAWSEDRLLPFIGFVLSLPMFLTSALLFRRLKSQVAKDCVDPGFDGTS